MVANKDAANDVNIERTYTAPYNFGAKIGHRAARTANSSYSIK